MADGNTANVGTPFDLRAQINSGSQWLVSNTDFSEWLAQQKMPHELFHNESSVFELHPNVHSASDISIFNPHATSLTNLQLMDKTKPPRLSLFHPNLYPPMHQPTLPPITAPREEPRLDSITIPSSSNQMAPHSKMDAFPPENVQDFKHVLYNLLVENHNHPGAQTFVQPCVMNIDGVQRQGFRFNSRQNPEKKLPELYAQHLRKARLDWEDQNSVFIQDLYKYYLRACVELLSKYFDKRDKYLYLYDDMPLFIPGESLEKAEERLRNMKTRARKKRKQPK